MVYIILVNWNGWRDTIECLESVLRLNYDQFRVVVCDNCSADDSLDRIADWAQGKVVASCSNPDLRHLTSPALEKPIPFLRLASGETAELATRSEKLILVQTGANLGFAGGNNVGLRMALAAGDLEYAWLLNNDTVVDCEALSALIETMKKRPNAGMCGSTLLYYQAPQLIQALGGSIYNRLFARVAQIGFGMPITLSLAKGDEVERRINYVAGASMFVSRPFLERIGLMSEEYFLYFEEIDWATRAKGKFGMAYCPESVVYHKEGSSIGTSNIPGKPRSVLCERFAARNRLLFTKKHYPEYLPTVLAAILLSAFHRLLTGQFQCFLAISRAISGGLMSRPASDRRY